jgi:hypothetical protein
MVAVASSVGASKSLYKFWPLKLTGKRQVRKITTLCRRKPQARRKSE